MKASVYIETSVFSYLTARPSNDLRATANQSMTLEWWETERPNYSVFVSELVISEASKGHPEAAQRRLAAIGDLPLLQISPEVRILAQALIEDHALPVKAEADAYHVAIAVINGIEYLLTWNCTHIANAQRDLKSKPPVGHMVTNRPLSVHHWNLPRNKYVERPHCY